MKRGKLVCATAFGYFRVKRDMKKTMLVVCVVLAAFLAPAWDVEHDEVAQLTGEFLPKEMRDFFTFDDFAVLMANCHAPDEIEWPMPDGKHRYRNAAELEVLAGTRAVALFRACGFDGCARWFHTPKARAAMMAVMARSFATGDGRAAAFCLSALTHAVADQSALNHPPLLQFVQYSRFEGVDYAFRKVEPGAKNVFGFRSDGFIVHRVRQILRDFRPQVPSGTLSDATLELVADAPRQSACSADKEGDIAFAPLPEAEEALAQLVAMQVRMLVTMAWTSWEHRAADAPLPGTDFEARYEALADRVTRSLDPSGMAVFRGIFDPSLDPPNPKGTLYLVCEPYVAMHTDRLLYGGRMIGAAALRTARDSGWAVRGISFWRIADADVLPKPGKGVKLVMVGDCGRWKGAEAVADQLKAWREAGGELIYLGGGDVRDISGFARDFEVHPDDEIASARYGSPVSGDWRKMSLTWKGVRYPQKRDGSFAGFSRPECNLGIRPGRGIEEIARFSCGDREFLVAARRGNVTWVPMYALMPFLYSDDTTADWREMRLDSVASCFFLDVLAGEEPVDWADPLLGSNGDAGMMPYVGAPFGAVQHVPMTRVPEIGILSFDQNDTVLMGHAGSRHMAVWMGEWGQFSFQASAGAGIPPCGFAERGLRLEREKCDYRPYCYRTVAGGVATECSGTSHAAIYRVTFPEGQVPRLVVDASRDFLARPLLDAGLNGDTNAAPGRIVLEPGNRRLVAWNRDNADRNLGPAPSRLRAHLVMTFSEPFAACGTFSGDGGRGTNGYQTVATHPGERTAEADRVGAYLLFKPAAKGPTTLIVRTGVSLIDAEQAAANLRQEIGERDFGAVATMARKAWVEQLGKIRIETPRADVKRIFYTAMYHAHICPRELSEHGRYHSPFDDRVHEGENYTSFSLWDTHRAQHPLLLLTAPERVDAMMGALLRAYREGGRFPRYPNPCYTGVMVGAPAEVVIAEAFLKGFRGFDAAAAYAAMREEATVPVAGDADHPWGDRDVWNGAPEARSGLTRYMERGYVVCNETAESVSRTQDFAYDDAAVSLMARALGHADDADLFARRSHCWTNLWHAALETVRPRRADGSWAPVAEWKKWRPYTELTEASALWCVPHDPALLCKLLGGPERMEARLDEFYRCYNYDFWAGKGSHRTTHSNEPSHHIPYLYNFVGAYDKCAERVRAILEHAYSAEPWAIEGNEDCGQMSAWYILSALGFYPLFPPDGLYETGSPLVDAAEIRLGPWYGNAVLRIRAVNQSKENTRVASVTFNGVALPRRQLRHADLVRGGELVFTMAKGEPCCPWATEPKDAIRAE